MKTDFMLIGVSKFATSKISSLLNQHSDIYMVRDGTHLFCDDALFEKGLDWYKQNFADAKLGQPLGDRSDLNSMNELFPHTISCIYQYNTNLKFIYCVRHLTTRIESYWMQIRSLRGEKLHYNFNQSVRINRDWLVDASNYWRKIELYRSYFSDEQIHIVFFEDYKENPKAIVKTCFDFLGVDPSFNLSKPNLHIKPSKGKKILRNLLSNLRSHSWFRSAVKGVPRMWRNPLKKRLPYQNIQGRPEWNPHEFLWVKDNLQDDIERFLEFYRKRSDYWAFDRPMTV